MDKSNLLITVIIVLCIAAAIAAYGITNNNSPIFSNLSSIGANDNGNGIGNNTSVDGNNPAGTGGNSNNGNGNSNNGAGSGSSSSSNSGSGQYSDWQRDYETGTYDSDGNPIYRSVISTSGGQNAPGIYETYWSANGPISEEKIG